MCLSIPVALIHAWQLVLFDVIPTFIDIVVALIVFALKLGWILTVVAFFDAFVYGAYRGIFGDFHTPIQLHLVVATILLTRRRTRLRRAMNDLEAVRRYISPQLCLLNCSTRLHVLFTLTVFLTMRRSSISMVRNMKVSVIATQSGSTKSSSTASLVSDIDRTL